MVIAVLAITACGAAADESAPAESITLEEARGLSEFPLFYGGERVDGLPLARIIRRRDTADYVSFVYGECEPRADTGCAPPAEIQVWPACQRSLALYGVPAPVSPSLEPVTIHGVPAAFLDGGARLEIQTGTSTVVVFSSTRARATRIGAALRPLGSQAAATALPPPAPGALDGTLEC